MKRFLHYFTPASVPLRAVAIAASVLIVGCSTSEHQDLRDKVSAIKQRPARPIPPLPEFESYESYTYSSAELPDPFWPRQEAVIADEPQMHSASGVRPPENRNPEELESFPLDGLAFVGMLDKRGETWAIIKAPDNLVHRVQVGNHMGQNYGRVVSITEARIDIEEIVPDGLGGWIKRDASLAITE